MTRTGSLVAAPRADRRGDLAQVLEQAASEHTWTSVVAPALHRAMCGNSSRVGRTAPLRQGAAPPAPPQLERGSRPASALPAMETTGSSPAATGSGLNGTGSGPGREAPPVTATAGSRSTAAGSGLARPWICVSPARAVERMESPPALLRQAEVARRCCRREAVPQGRGQARWEVVQMILKRRDGCFIAYR